jgi:DNA-binding LacI/PurR family transcriptional regulator
VVLLAEDTGEESSQRAYTRLVEEGRIDGLLVASARIGQTVLGREGDDVPCVFVNRRRARSGRNVVMREEDAGRIAARHLLDLGHTRLGVLAGPTDLDTARRRMRGFMSEVKAAGAQARVVHAAYEESAARAAMGRLLGMRPRPTAIFISNLNQAIGAVAAVREQEIAVPRELSLIACDEDPIVEFLGVPLTTIKMPLTQLGVAAVDALLEQIAGAPPRNMTVPDRPALVERASTAAPVPGT